MSRENVEVVRTLLEMFRQRDHERVFDFYDQAIEWDASRLADLIPDTAGTYHGHDGVRTYWRRWLQAWDELEFEVEDLVDAGDEVVAMIGNQRQRGRHSGIITTMPPYALIFTIHDGKVTRWRAYPDRAGALEAVGLSEQATSQENVEAVYRAERAFNEGDVETFASFLHPDIEWETGLLGTPTYRGHDGVRRMFRDVQAAWADIQMEIVGDPAQRDDAVMLEVRLMAHGRSTGAPVEATQFWVSDFRDGLCVRHRTFLTRTEALEAVGLSE